MIGSANAEQRVVKVYHRNAVWPQRFPELSLFLQYASRRPEPFQVGRRILIRTPVVGEPICASRSISPETFLPISTTASPMFSFKPKKRKREGQ